MSDAQQFAALLDRSHPSLNFKLSVDYDSYDRELKIMMDDAPMPTGLAAYARLFIVGTSESTAMVLRMPTELHAARR